MRKLPTPKERTPKEGTPKERTPKERTPKSQVAESESQFGGRELRYRDFAEWRSQ
jgi:hypothetical protein